jgi:GPI-anchor transamidase subunit GAA1
MIGSLPLKSGALQGAVCIDFPLDHRFEKISISYDGINGQLPNLDLVNTAVSVAGGQMGIGTSIQGMHRHDDSYRARLMTMLRGMSNQAAGHGAGAHSVFMPYHIDAITVTATGDGWQDEMALGRTVESICRSLNNLLEHFHQSFFFYLLMQTNRFVSIGTYLPSAMAVAAGFTIMAIYLWVKSGYDELAPSLTEQDDKAGDDSGGKTLLEDARISHPSPKGCYKPIERQLFGPILLISMVHLFSLVPLYLSNHAHYKVSLLTTLRSISTIVLIGRKTNSQKFQLKSSFLLSCLFLFLPLTIARSLPPIPTSTYQLTKSLSLLILGLFLSALATLNFSLSLALGVLCVPILFANRDRGLLGYFNWAALMLVSPMGLWAIAYVYVTFVLGDAEWGNRTLARVAFGWNVLGSWGIGVGIWVVWFPAWLVAAILGLT